MFFHENFFSELYRYGYFWPRCPNAPSTFEEVFRFENSTDYRDRSVEANRTRAQRERNSTPSPSPVHHQPVSEEMLTTFLHTFSICTVSKRGRTWREQVVSNNGRKTALYERRRMKIPQ